MYKFTRKELIKKWTRDESISFKDDLLAKKDYYGEVMNEIESQKIMMEQVPNKQKTDWENIKSLLLCENYIYYCDLNNEDLDKLSKFISQLLKTQREEIVSEIDGIVGKNEYPKKDDNSVQRNFKEGRNQLRSEIREILKQIK